MGNTVKEEIKNTIRQVMGELVDFDMNDITDDQMLVEEMGINSITIVQIFLSCQEKYGVLLADEMRLTDPMSIEMLSDKIMKKMEEKERAGK